MILDQRKRVIALVVAALSSFASPLGAQCPPRPPPPVVAGCRRDRVELMDEATSCAQPDRRDSHCSAPEWKDPYTLIKDRDLQHKSDSYLIIPTARVAGIEDCQIFLGTYDNLWIDGWHSSHNLGKHTERTGLAINSCHNRTEDQLHIHLSCVHSWVIAQLSSIQDYPIFTPLPLIKGHNYEATRVDGLTGEKNPFKVIQKKECADKAGTDLSACMANQSIAVIEDAEHANHYYVLNTSYAESDTRTGHAEELLDQNCPAR